MNGLEDAAEMARGQAAHKATIEGYIDAACRPRQLLVDGRVKVEALRTDSSSRTLFAMS